MPMPLSRTRISTSTPCRLALSMMRPPGSVYFAALFEKIAEHLGEARESPTTSSTSSPISIVSSCRCFGEERLDDVSMARATMVATGTGSRLRLMLPRVMRDTSSKSSTEPREVLHLPLDHIA
mgnify:CR=1 FL=1